LFDKNPEVLSLAVFQVSPIRVSRNAVLLRMGEARSFGRSWCSYTLNLN
jgi:hypothetical protein